MLGERYVVRRGDSLWKIARQKLGAGREWPRIWRYNNRGDVMRETGRGVPNPDLILVDQVLLLPIVATMPSVAPSVVLPAPPAPSAPPNHPDAGTGPLERELPSVRSPISFKYRLDDMVLPPMQVPGAKVEMRMTGDILLVSRNTYPALYVTQLRQVELQLNNAANGVVQQMFSDVRATFDGRNGRLELRAMAGASTGAWTAVAAGVDVDPHSGAGRLRFEFRFPNRSGHFDGVFDYVATDIKIVLTVEPEGTPGGPFASDSNPLATRGGFNWGAAALVGAAGAIIVATLVEDFFTAGAGVADDPASFAMAGAALARASRMIAGAAAELPRALVPMTLRPALVLVH